MSKIYRLEDVCAIVGLHRATIYRKIKEGTFPEPVKLSARAIGWKEEQITSWIESLGK